MQHMEKNTYPKIKDKSNRWRRTPHQRFQEYFPPLPKARPNSEHGFTRIHVEHSSLGLPMKFPIVGGLFLVYARPSGTGCTHARTHTQGIRRKIVPLSRTDYQEFPGTINLLAATPQAPFPPPPPLLFFRQPHSPSLQVKPPERDPSSLLSETVSQVVAPIRNHYHDRKRPRSSSVRGANCPRGRGCADCREEE